MKRDTLIIGGMTAALVIVMVVSVVLEYARRPDWGAAALTVGDIHAVHAQVTVAEREVRGHARIADGAKVSTGKNGRARVRLDDGTVAVVDHATTPTRHPAQMTATDLVPLRQLGLDDGEILDLANAIAVFAWANRLMLTLGEPEEK